MNNPEKHTENYDPVRVNNPATDAKGRGAENSLVLLRDISEETIAQIKQTSGHDLELAQYIGKDSRAVYERYLGITMNTDKVIKLGETLLLMFVLIRKCGEGDCCVSNYAPLAEACRVSVSTIKVWSNKLEKLGFIHKQISGPNGMTFTLNNDGIGRSDVFRRIDRQLFQSAEQIRATMVVTQNAFKQALASLLLQTGGAA